MPGEPVKENNVEPSCEMAGGYDMVTYCMICHEKLATEHTDVPALGHAWDDGVVTSAAGCTDDGVMLYTCTRCGETRTEVISATGHTPGEPARENDVAPTCTTEGSYDMVIRCTVCGSIISSEHFTVPALGHDYAATVTPPTCTEQGYTTFICSRCGDSYVDDYVDPLGHAWGEPEWTWDGDTAAAKFVCANDSDHVETMNATVISQTTPATCEADGQTIYTATVEFNGKTYTNKKTVILPATGHTPGEPVRENEVAATCTTAGSYDEVVYCTACGAELSRETVAVPATGHDWGTPTYEWADDNSTVTAARVCANDATHVETETVETTYTVVTEPTTMSEGAGVYTAVFTNGAFTTQTRQVVIPKLPGYHVIVDDKTKGNATVIGIDSEMLYNGAVTFTVTCADACVVAIDKGNDVYEVVKCTTTESGEHQFTVTVTDADVTIVIAIKGDANLDGKREAKDATFAAQAIAGKRTFTALQKLVCDGTGDGAFDGKDATYAAQVVAGKRSYKW